MKKKYLRPLLIIILSLLTFGCANTAPPPAFKNFKELKEANIVMQSFDYSCGAGALATLLTYYFNDPISEAELLDDILKHIPKELIENRKKDGLSLFDLKQAAERKGYKAFGVRLKNSSLLKLSCPALIYLKTEDYQHFAILKGVKEDRFFLADPRRGNIRISADRFIKEWKGKLALVLYKKNYKPKKHNLSIAEDIFLRPELETVKIIGF